MIPVHTVHLMHLKKDQPIRLQIYIQPIKFLRRTKCKRMERHTLG